MPVKLTMEISRGDAMRGDVQLSQLLRDAAHSKGITNQRLAEEAKIPKCDVSRYLSGRRRPSIARLMRLAALLDLDYDALLQIYNRDGADDEDEAR